MHDKLVAFGRMLQGRGFSVSENTAFGGVTAGAHRAGSLHYEDNAIDVNDDGRGQAYENTQLSKVAAWARADGLHVLWQVPGHFNHAHVDTGLPLGPASLNSYTPGYLDTRPAGSSANPWTSTAPAAGSSATAAPAAFGLPSTAGLTRDLENLAVLSTAVVAGVALVLVGLNRATGNPAGKAAQAAPLLAI
jgi:hypothetical protein